MYFNPGLLLRKSLQELYLDRSDEPKFMDNDEGNCDRVKALYSDCLRCDRVAKAWWVKLENGAWHLDRTGDCSLAVVRDALKQFAERSPSKFLVESLNLRKLQSIL